MILTAKAPNNVEISSHLVIYFKDILTFKVKKFLQQILVNYKDELGENFCAINVVYTKKMHFFSSVVLRQMIKIAVQLTLQTKILLIMNKFHQSIFKSFKVSKF